MSLNNRRLGGLILLAVISVGLMAWIAARHNGEILSVARGEIQKCEYLGGGKSESLPHATIKTESGDYLVSKFAHCRAGIDVNVFVRRGMLYFNTRYSAEEAKQ